MHEATVEIEEMPLIDHEGKELGTPICGPTMAPKAAFS